MLINESILEISDVFTNKLNCLVLYLPLKDSNEYSLLRNLFLNNNRFGFCDIQNWKDLEGPTLSQSHIMLPDFLSRFISLIENWMISFLKTFREVPLDN